MKKWLFTLLLLVVFPLMASHIVGGEFELIHLSGNRYQLNLIIYFDKVYGNPGALDTLVTASIYRKSDNHFMTSVFLPLADSSDVGYTIPDCSHGEIQTRKLIYTNAVTLPDDTYNDPDGYFVVWQRCCRNYQITNIYSETPLGNNDPNSAGQTFYLEFPPVVKNGQPFINSSPRLFPPLNDYACPNRPYYVNFAGVDDDGDSLVYSLVDPWNTLSSVSLPPAAPGPFPPVKWRPGYGLHNIMNGAPDLRITNGGFLTCTPTLKGLYVFAVQVLQFRNKLQIGVSRRDFQMLVVEGCQPAQAPQIVGVDALGTHQPTMSVSFSNTVPDSSRCVQVRVSDPDSQELAYNFLQNVTIRAIAINFNKKDLSSILPDVTYATLLNGSTHDFSICFPQCPYFNGPLEIGIIAYDESCSLPLTDTLKLTVSIQPPPNTPPYFTTPTPVNAVLNEGTQASWPFVALDRELDSMVVYLVTDGFVLADAGMTFTITKNQKGIVSGQLQWDAYCNIYDFTKRTSFQVQVRVDDLDKCSLDDPVVAVYNLSVKLPGVANPFIDTDLTSDPHEHLVPGLVRQVGESLSFDVTGTQADNDYLVLEEAGPGLFVTSASFLKASGTGSVVSHFQWDIRCDNVDLKKQDTFEFQFVLLDSANKCRFIKTDTVTVVVTVVLPDNERPDLVIQNQNQLALPNNQLSIILGEPISLNLLGTDADVNPKKDSLTLQLLSATVNVAPAGYTFTTATGLGNVEAPFTWNPDCSIFNDGVYQNDYTFKFSVMDNRCFNAKGDTVTLSLNIKDRESTGKEFLPANIITPNGDGCNDYFAVEGMDPGCGASNPDEIISFPKDNCTGRFQLVRIHNRWGTQVFESTERNFRWYAPNESAGVYYYIIEFSNSQYKGVLSVRP